MITSIHGNLTRNVEMSKSDFSIFGTEIVRVRCVTFFGLDVLGNSLSFVGVFYHFYCYCCCCCCIYTLLSTNYIGLPSYYFITFHYFRTSLLLFRAIDCFFFLSPLPLLPFILHFTSTAFEHHRFLLFLKQHRSFVITCKYCIVFMNGMIRFPFHFSNSPVSDLEHLYCVSLKQIWFIYGKHIIKKIVFFPLQNILLIQATFLFSLHKFPRLSVYCRLSFYLFYNTKFLTFPFISTSLYVFVIQE